MAKRVEGYYDKNTDYVITFEELDAMIKALGIDIASCEPVIPDNSIEKSGRLYARTGGVAASVAQYTEHSDKLTAEVINGLDKDAVKFLKSVVAAKQSDSTLIEVMMCEGGCVNGCSVITSPKAAARQLGALEKKGFL